MGPPTPSKIDSMRNSILLLVSVLLVLTSALSAQELSRDDFLKSWKQGVELEDDKVMDRAVKGGSRHVIQHYEGLAFQARNGDDVEAELQVIKKPSQHRVGWGHI